MSITTKPCEDTSRRIYKFEDVADECIEWGRALHEAKEAQRPLGPTTGFEAVDEQLCGAFHPGIHVLHGQPGSGKTAFALQVACECGFPALYVTAEMSPAELLRRTAARIAGKPVGKFRDGSLTAKEYDKFIRDAAKKCPSLTILDATRDAVSKEEIRDAAEAVREDDSPVFVVVDSVHAWAWLAYIGPSEYDQLNQALMDLRILSTETCSPVLVVAERNRASLEKGGQSASAGTRKFEYGAETVMGLEKDEDLERKTSDPEATAVKLKFHKNRHGAPGKHVCLQFHGSLQEFAEAPS